jgi:hypothetical protein
MDRLSSYPKQDFEGMVLEIWSGCDTEGDEQAGLRIPRIPPVSRRSSSQVPHLDRTLNRRHYRQVRERGCSKRYTLPRHDGSEGGLRIRFAPICAHTVRR